MNSEITEMVFRVDKSTNDVFVLMPYIVTNGTNVLSYQHIGQHSDADYHHCIKTSRPATINESQELKKELEGLGYNVKPIAFYNHRKYVEAYNKSKSI